MPTVPARKNVTYKSGATSLDTPHVATAPVLLSGYALAYHSFMLIWNTPSVATSQAMTNGAIVPMTFAAHDGSPISTPVKVESSTIGSLLIATLTILSQVKVTQ